MGQSKSKRRLFVILIRVIKAKEEIGCLGVESALARMFPLAVMPVGGEDRSESFLQEGQSRQAVFLHSLFFIRLFFSLFFIYLFISLFIRLFLYFSIN